MAIRHIIKCHDKFVLRLHTIFCFSSLSISSRSFEFLSHRLIPAPSTDVCMCARAFAFIDILIAIAVSMARSAVFRFVWWFSRATEVTPTKPSSQWMHHFYVKRKTEWPDQQYNQIAWKNTATTADATIAKKLALRTAVRNSYRIDLNLYIIHIMLMHSGPM